MTLELVSFFARVGALRSIGAALLATLLISLLSSCTVASTASEPIDAITPIEEQQIKNVVQDYYVRQPAVVPEYEAKIEEARDGWARVSIRPVGVESAGSPDVFYLQNQLESGREPPTPTDVLTSSQTVRTSTATGWVIVAGPQAQYTEDELNAAGVPMFIRP